MWLLLGLILPEVSTFSWYYFTGGLPILTINFDQDTVKVLLEAPGQSALEMNGVLEPRQPLQPPST
jgi:hypothetical protein